MPLPNFLCVGAQKAGTTTLYNILKQHPEIYLPDVKEIKFFNEKYYKGINFYKQFFNKWRREKAIGEIDPDYMFFDVEKVVERIYKNLGKNIKLIFMLRNPVDRAYSQYWMNVRRGYEKESFAKAIDLESQRIKMGSFNKHNFSYIHRGYYFSQIKEFLKYFPKENMFFIIFEEDFLKNRQETINKLLRFLNVSSIKLNINIKSNSASLPKIKFLNEVILSLRKIDFIKKSVRIIVPSERTRCKLITFLEKVNQKPFSPPKLDISFKNYLIKKYFLDEIKQLERLINRDLSIWYKS